MNLENLGGVLIIGGAVLAAFVAWLAVCDGCILTR